MCNRIIDRTLLYAAYLKRGYAGKVTIQDIRDVISLPKQVCEHVKNWTEVEFADSSNSITISKSENIDGTAYNELFAIFTYCSTRGFPRTNFDNYTIWLKAWAYLDKNDVNVLWECDPTSMTIINIEGRTTSNDAQSKFAVNMFQDKMKENLRPNITLEEMKWRRMEELTLDIRSFRRPSDNSWVEPQIIIGALESLKSLHLRCLQFKDDELNSLRKLPIPDTWEKMEFMGPTGMNFIYTPKTVFK